MKVLIAPLNTKIIQKSGIGRAITHQKNALETQGIEYVTDLKQPYDLIHANTYDFHSLYLVKRAKKKGIPVIIHAHSTEEDFCNSFRFSNVIAPTFRKWLIYFYRHADLLLTPTPYSKKTLEHYKIGPPIVDISNGIDLSKFTPDSQGGDDFRKEFGFSKDRKLVVTVGFPMERKGIVDFVEMAKRMPEYDFAWCGHLEDYLLPSRVVKLKKTKLDNMKFLGYVSGIERAYQAADLFFMPSKEETEGIVMLEALASRLPIVCRRIGAFMPWLQNNKNVFMAQFADGFEERIKDVLEERIPNIDEVVNAGYGVAAEREITKIGERLKKIYEYMISGEYKNRFFSG